MKAESGKRKAKTCLVLCLWFVVAIGLSSGCTTTIAPKAPVVHQVSHGSGLVKPSVDGAPAVLNAMGVANYNALIALQPSFRKNGKAFPVPLQPNDGITARADGDYDIAPAYQEKFAIMAGWYRAGLWREK